MTSCSASNSCSLKNPYHFTFFICSSPLLCPLFPPPSIISSINSSLTICILKPASLFYVDLFTLHLTPPHLIFLQPRPRMASPWRFSPWRVRRRPSLKKRRRKKRPNQWRRSTWLRRRSQCCRANWPDWLYKLGRLVRTHTCTLTHSHTHTQTATPVLVCFEMRLFSLRVSLFWFGGSFIFLLSQFLCYFQKSGTPPLIAHKVGGWIALSVIGQMIYWFILELKVFPASFQLTLI